jgi:hypothetical protein
MADPEGLNRLYVCDVKRMWVVQTWSKKSYASRNPHMLEPNLTLPHPTRPNLVQKDPTVPNQTGPNVT